MFSQTETNGVWSRIAGVANGGVDNAYGHTRCLHRQVIIVVAVIVAVAILKLKFDSSFFLFSGRSRQHKHMSDL